MATHNNFGMKLGPTSLLIVLDYIAMRGKVIMEHIKEDLGPMMVPFQFSLPSLAL